MYMKQIEQLVVLQQVDNAIIQLDAQLTAAPLQVRELEENLASLNEREQLFQEKLRILNEQKTRLELEIEQDDLKVKRSKNKLMMVENTKEYHAMMREMDNLEKLNRIREEERTTVLEDLKELKDELLEVTEEISKTTELLAEKKNAMQGEVDEAEKEMAKHSSRRKKAQKDIPAPIMARYDFIRKRIKNPVIVPVSEGVCHGCHISIPPQSFIELQKGQQILSCPNCQRLIYWSSHFTSEDAQSE